MTGRSGAEFLLRCAPVTDEVLIADRGYAKAKELWACLTAGGAQARGFIVRVGWKALARRDLDANPFHPIGFMQAPGAGAGLREVAVQAAAGRSGQPATSPLRLIVVPLPADKAAANRTKLKRTASKHQDTLDPRSLVAAGFMVLATTLPGDIPAGEICAA